jgi:hypothetical protein
MLEGIIIGWSWNNNEHIIKIIKQSSTVTDTYIKRNLTVTIVT